MELSDEGLLFGIEDWEKLYIERRLREKKLSGEFLFFREALDISNVEKAKDADILSVFIYSKLTPEVIDKMLHLKLIITRSSGYDHIDVDYALKKGIKVAHIPGYGNNTVAEYTFALILALARKMKPMIENSSKGIFTREGLMGIDIMGKIIGIVGTGRIGSHVARIAYGFGMRILAYDRSKNMELVEKYNVDYVGLEELLSRSDIVTVHLPYNRATHFLINRFNIKLMKLDAMLINTSRGEVVELDAIVEALKEGRLAGGVGLDTIETEITVEEELMKKTGLRALKLKKAAEAKYLLSQANVIVSPHVAYYTKDASERILDMTVDNIQKFITEGEVVTPVPET
ncbi:MAG: NAD(P)-dependent oxidoreductase [Persephonella sp.]|nr:NAD(P)-dependent oxidoreductase [Persephonella sp.]